MFKVKSIFNGHVYTVYAVSGGLFLVWNDSTEDERWEWIDMEQFKPVASPQEIAPQAFPPVTTSATCRSPRNDKEEGPGALLHNKECPYGYKCKAMDCIECMEIYGRENEES